MPIENEGDKSNSIYNNLCGLLSVNLGSHGTLQEVIAYAIVGSVFSMTGIAQFKNINDSTFARDQKLTENFDEAKHEAEKKHSEALLAIKNKKSCEAEVRRELSALVANIEVSFKKLQHEISFLNESLILINDYIKLANSKKEERVEYDTLKGLYEERKNLACTLAEKTLDMQKSQFKFEATMKAIEHFDILCGLLSSKNSPKNNSFLESQRENSQSFSGICAPLSLTDTPPTAPVAAATTIMPVSSVTPDLPAAMMVSYSAYSPIRRRSVGNLKNLLSVDADKQLQVAFIAWMDASKLVTEFSASSRLCLLPLEVDYALHLCEESHAKTLDELNLHRVIASDALHEEASQHRAQYLRHMVKNPVNQIIAGGLFVLTASKYVVPVVSNYLRPKTN